MRANGPRSEFVGEGYGLDRLQQVMLAARAESIYGGTTQINSICLPSEPWSCRVSRGRVGSGRDGDQSCQR